MTLPLQNVPLIEPSCESRLIHNGRSRAPDGEASATSLIPRFVAPKGPTGLNPNFLTRSDLPGPMERRFNTHSLTIFYLVDFLRQRRSRWMTNLKGLAKVFSQISQTQLEQTFAMMPVQ
jgi:hypothetical protein